MDGLLVVDKPAGPTSHDVVAIVRRTLHEPRVGHTGTLDPLATGVLPLVIGKATRLARFVTAGSKSYVATIRLGASTDSYDADGRVVGETYGGPMPSIETVDAALQPFRGTFLQQPPRYSAKKIGGERSHRTARRRTAVEERGDDAPDVPLPEPVSVTAHAIVIAGLEGSILTLQVDCSAGFYVRALAHDLGASLGTGAYIHALRRTRSGELTLDQAVELATVTDPVLGRERVSAALVPLERMLPDVPRIDLTERGERRASHGQPLGPEDVAGTFPEALSGETRYRLFSPDGRLIGVAEREATPPALHPAVVLV